MRRAPLGYGVSIDGEAEGFAGTGHVSSMAFHRHVGLPWYPKRRFASPGWCWERSAGKIVPDVIQQCGNHSNAFMHLVFSIHAPNATLVQLGLERCRRGVYDYLGVAVRAAV